MRLANHIFIVVLLLVVSVACKRQVDTSHAPELIYGEDVCERCGMIINEERFAAAYWTTDGEARRFDDIGGMLAYHLEQEDEVASFWVHDVNSAEWLHAEDAYFVIGADLETPMGFNVVACSDKATADALAAGRTDAMIMRFDSLMSQLQSGELNLDPMRMDSSMGEGEEDMNGMDMESTGD